MKQSTVMNLQINSLSGYQLQLSVVKIVGEATSGSFCLLPRHRDMATSLAAGLMEIVAADGTPVFLAVDEGLLTKRGDSVSVCTRQATRGTDLESLRQVLEQEFAARDDREHSARAAIARLEADFARRFLALREQLHD